MLEIHLILLFESSPTTLKSKMGSKGWTTYASIFIKKLNTVQMEKENRLHRTLMLDDQHIARQWKTKHGSLLRFKKFGGGGNYSK